MEFCSAAADVVCLHFCFQRGVQSPLGRNGKRAGCVCDYYVLRNGIVFCFFRERFFFLPDYPGKSKLCKKSDFPFGNSSACAVPVNLYSWFCMACSSLFWHGLCLWFLELDHAVAAVDFDSVVSVYLRDLFFCRFSGGLFAGYAIYSRSDFADSVFHDSDFLFDQQCSCKIPLAVANESAYDSY